MDAIMYIITEYYWLFIILAAVLLISILGIYVEGRREKAEETGEKIDNQILFFIFLLDEIPKNITKILGCN